MSTTVRFSVSRNNVHTVLIIIQLVSNIMSFGFMSGFNLSEEERKKRREQFDDNRTKLGFGANVGQSGLLGAGKLNQQVQGAQIAPTPAQTRMQEASSNGRQQRTQALGQIQTNRQERDKTQAAALAQAREVARLPVRAQAQAIENMKSQVQKRTQPTTGLGISPLLAKPKPGPKLGMGLSTQSQPEPSPKLGMVPRVQPQPLPGPKLGMVNSTNYGKPASNNISDKTIADDAKASAGNYDDIGTIGSDNVWKGNPDNKSFGLSVTPTPDRDPVADFAKSTQSVQSNLGFNVPRAPMRSWSERQEREALLRDTSTAYKGSQNGQLTANQMELRASIIGADDKYKNDQYNSQLGAASQVAQTQATQAGANARAALSEVGSNSRLNTQLGFDVDEFQRIAAQQDQRLGLDSRRLDVEQANNDVQNLGTKSLNNLYEKYQTAKTDDQKSEIAAQIRDLKGTALETENWTNIGGGERLSDDGFTSTKNPDILLNKNTGETKEIPKNPIDFIRDPRAIAILKNRSLSDDEMHAQLMALE